MYVSIWQIVCLRYRYANDLINDAKAEFSTMLYAIAEKPAAH